jgi:hypothetical protein
MWALALGLLAAAPPAGAQGTGLDLTYGRWWPDSTALIYSVGYHHPLRGPFDWGVAVSHVDDGRAVPDRTQTGAELTLGLGRHGRGLYGLASTGLAMRHRDGNLDAAWSVGVGWAVSLLSYLSFALEARYRTEDQDTRGFWRLLPSDRRGIALQGRVAIGILRSPRRPEPARPDFHPPSQGEIIDLSRDTGAAPETARAADVVRTAIDVMGTPYTWGGSNENGYDCSGLIQYAYGQHGIILPRVSRDQVRMGRPVERQLDALRPGDILGFSVEGDRITHVGLYVGEGQFIHSASGGVRLSSLSATDGDSRWWHQHWLVARRILQ